MRVLIFTQYYPPEVGATQNRMQYFAAQLAARGHEVTVVTEVPNHPKGVIFPEYRGKWWTRTLEDGVTTIRVWVRTAPIKTLSVRLAFYLSYAVNGALASLLLSGRRQDVVFITSPPLTVGLPALVYSGLRRVPLVLDIRDLWPAIAEELGEMRSRRALSMARGLERLLYRRAAAVTVVTRGFGRYVQEHGYPAERTVLIPNGTTPDIFHPQAPDPALRHRLGLDGCFVVGFFGNHGIAQDLEGVLDAAARLKSRPDIRFLFVGEGPAKAGLQLKQDALGLDNVLFLPQVPLREILTYVALADTVVVPLRRLDLFKTFIPSKLFDFMACARPVLLQVDGEARQILEEAGGGTFVPPGDSAALAAAIDVMARCPAEDRAAMGERGRIYVHQHYLREHQADRLDAVLRSVVAGVAPSGTGA